MEDVQHLSVLREGLGDEPGDPATPGCFGKVFEEQGPDPLMLVLVRDDECDLCLVGAGLPLVTGDRDQALPVESDQGEPIGVVDVGEPRQLLVGERRVSREETSVDGAGREAAVELDEHRRVGGADRP